MNRFYRWFQITMATAVLGTAFQPLTGCAGKVLRNVNPCGTILNCDPLEYDLAFQENYPDWDADMTCTIPGLCGTTPDPGGVGGIGTIGTTGTTGTTTTGTTTGTGTGFGT